MCHGTRHGCDTRRGTLCHALTRGVSQLCLEIRIGYHYIWEKGLTLKKTLRLLFCPEFVTYLKKVLRNEREQYCSVSTDSSAPLTCCLVAFPATLLVEILWGELALPRGAKPLHRENVIGRGCVNRLFGATKTPF